MVKTFFFSLFQEEKIIMEKAMMNLCEALQVQDRWIHHFALKASWVRRFSQKEKVLYVVRMTVLHLPDFVLSSAASQFSFSYCNAFVSSKYCHLSTGVSVWSYLARLKICLKTGDNNVYKQMSKAIFRYHSIRILHMQGLDFE